MSARRKPIESRYAYYVTARTDAVHVFLDGRPRGFKVGCSATSPREAVSKVRRMIPEGDWVIQLVSVSETRGDWGDDDVE